MELVLVIPEFPQLFSIFIRLLHDIIGLYDIIFGLYDILYFGLNAFAKLCIKTSLFFLVFWNQEGDFLCIDIWPVRQNSVYYSVGFSLDCWLICEMIEINIFHVYWIWIKNDTPAIYNNQKQPPWALFKCRYASSAVSKYFMDYWGHLKHNDFLQRVHKTL